MKQKVSATIITLNEENNIERCLASLNFVDEIIIVDSGSTDRTIQICNQYNCTVISTEWKGFGKTKAFAVENATYDWILSIDSDEVVTENLQKRIMNILLNPDADGYYIKRKSFYLGKLVKFSGWNSDYPLRLFNKIYGNFNEKTVHESVIVKGVKKKLEEHILHYTYPTIQSHIKKLDRYSELSAEELRKKGKRFGPVLSVFFGINRFLSMYFLKLGFLDGTIGFILAFNSAYGVYLKYIKTWYPK